MLIQNASWITMAGADSTAVPVFRKRFTGGKHVCSAVLEVTCDGVYEAVLNGRRVGSFMLAPGWTEYRKRLQVQSYDVTNLLEGDNTLEITVANGWVPEVIPSLTAYKPGGGAWSDAVTIIPWQLYQTYGDVSFLSDMYEAMEKWIAYIPTVSAAKDLWTGCWTYGDWLALDAPDGYHPATIELAKRGYSNDDLICSAFYANSVHIVIMAGRILHRDVSAYEALYSRITAAFRERFGGQLNTQTEKVLALHFNLADQPQALADALAEQIIACGTKLQTGLVGTPYLLHELSRYGHSDIAWSLLLRKEYPGWLYSVSKGATTMWEHWDGIKPDGTFWDDDMNSYNHYAYGSVADWVFSVACGIQAAEPGFAAARIAPQPDPRVRHMSAVLDTVHGRIRSFWKYTENGIRYEIDTPVRTEIVLDGRSRVVEKGSYVLFGGPEARDAET